MEKINIAELLKDCQKGMELDCSIHIRPVIFNCVKMESDYPIRISSKDGFSHSLTCWGSIYNCEDAKCVIFPKGKTTWEGFVPPCNFKDGDILSYQCEGFKNRTVYIYRYHKTLNTSYYVALSGDIDSEFMVNYLEGSALNAYNDTVRFATEEEKQKLFDAIKAKRYKWNAETKTLEKFVEPKFKDGDRIKRKGDTRLTTIKEVRDNYYIITIREFFDNAYMTDKLLFSNQNEYELVPDKFDISTLKPFDRVLVRGGVGQKWTHDFFGFMDKDKGLPFVCVGHYVIQCIPYEGNEHLFGKTDDCDDFYKNW